MGEWCFVTTGLSMRNWIAAVLISTAGLLAAPAHATATAAVEKVCTVILASYQSAIDRYDAAIEAYLDAPPRYQRLFHARYRFYVHLRHKAERSADFCECFLTSYSPGTSPVSQSCGYPYIHVSG